MASIGQTLGSGPVPKLPDIRLDLSRWVRQCEFLGLRVHRPPLLPGGYDAAACCLPQHSAAGDLNLSCNIFAEEKRRNSFQGQATGPQASECQTLSGSAQENHCGDGIAWRGPQSPRNPPQNVTRFHGRQQLRKTVPILRCDVQKPCTGCAAESSAMLRTWSPPSATTLISTTTTPSPSFGPPRHPISWKRSSALALHWIIVDLLAALH